MSRSLAPGSGITTIRNVRVPDKLWEAALAVAEDEGRPLAQIIRELLTEYVAAAQVAGQA